MMMREIEREREKKREGERKKEREREREGGREKITEEFHRIQVNCKYEIDILDI